MSLGNSFSGTETEREVMKMKEIKLTVTDEVYERLQRLALANGSDYDVVALSILRSGVFKYKTEESFQNYLDALSRATDFVRSLDK